MERPIGDTFEYEGKTLEVVEQPTCGKCFFWKKPCSKVDILGKCCKRNDGKEIIFKEVKANANANANADLPVSTPVSMTDEEKQKALQSLPHESIQAFSKLYANFIADCEQMGIRVCGVEFYAESRER